MFKSCCLGCGPRAKGHAAAYQHVTKATLEAVCDMNEERLGAFADEFAIPRRYTDVREMLEIIRALCLAKESRKRGTGEVMRLGG